jgi:3-hydroxyacyl-CoA dehydrogenase-like protein
VRLLAQLAYGFKERPDVRYGLTALCIGLGMGAALLWENASRSWRRRLPPGEARLRPRLTSLDGAMLSGAVLTDELESADWAALVVTGKPFIFAAGADINEFPRIRSREEAIAGSRAGHELFGRIRALPFPTVELEVKQRVFEELREIAPEAILASNTSSLSIADMGADVGMHFSTRSTSCRSSSWSVPQRQTT